VPPVAVVEEEEKRSADCRGGGRAERAGPPNIVGRCAVKLSSVEEAERGVVSGRHASRKQAVCRAATSSLPPVKNRSKGRQSWLWPVGMAPRLRWPWSEESYDDSIDMTSFMSSSSIGQVVIFRGAA
jgi:hypothetical protein